MIKKTFALVLFVCLIALNSFAQQEFFPFVAEVTADRVNVRAGENTNFEKIARVHKGDEVVVVDRKYSWYKIQIPQMAATYISDEFVLLMDEHTGEVIGSRVNVRAGAGANHTVLGQLKAGDKVFVIGHTQGWYKIKPLEKSYGWVHEDFVAFKSKTVDTYDPTELVARDDQRKQQELYLEQLKVQKQGGEVVEVAPVVTKKVDAYGIIKEEKYSGSDTVGHKLVVDGATAYYIEGQKYILDDFLHYEVKLIGEVQEEDQNHYSFPVVKLQEIQLVL